MRVEELNPKGFAKTYLITDDNSNDVFLIDPVFDFAENYLRLIEQQNSVLKYCIATHTHADHITACFTLRERTGCEYVMWKSTASLGVSLYVDENTNLSFADEEVSFYHVPGHTDDSMLINIGNYIFTGDFLFTGDGGVGRDDLPGGRLEDHWNSLKTLSRFPGEIIVCPGHDRPGAEMKTLEWNRKNNPILIMSSWDEYLQWQNNSVKKLGSVSRINVALPANIFGEIPKDIPWLK